MTKVKNLNRKPEGLTDAQTSTPNYSDIEWLKANDPKNFFEGHVSSKFDAEREVAIVSGLTTLAGMKEIFPINPLLILLALWWEVKPARAEIKKMIDAEAEAKGFDSADYLQNILGAEVEKAINIQTAFDRIRYAKTYYKPRAGVTPKVITKQINIKGITYNVPVVELEKAKIEFASDREAMAEYLISIAQPVEIETL